MKKICLLLTLLAAVFTANAAETSANWNLVVESTGGDTITIALSQKPVIATQAEGYKLTYGDQTVEFAWEELKKLSLEEAQATAIADAQLSTVKSQLAPGQITIRGAKAGSQVQLFAADGRQVLTARVADNGEAIVSTAALSAGIYVVKTANSAFKIIKK